MRLTMIKDYESMIVIPSLHLSQMSFFGMGKRDEYLIWKEVDDKFAVVDKNFKLIIWSKLTGQ